MPEVQPLRRWRFLSAGSLRFTFVLRIPLLLGRRMGGDLGCDFISDDRFQRQLRRAFVPATWRIGRMFWIENKLEAHDSDSRKSPPRLVVVQDYYFIALFGRFPLNDRRDFYSEFFLIQYRPPNLAVETE